MNLHPYFDLTLHDNNELNELLESPVSERITLHEWPLSCVQRLTLANGRTLIYKVQSPPTVEPEFYRLARSPLLVRCRSLPIAGRPPALVLEDIRAPNLEEAVLSKREIIRAADEIISTISQIEGDLLARSDIHSEARWLAHSETILANLEALAGSGVFHLVKAATIKKIARYCNSDAVLEAIHGQTGYVHNDLCGENVLRLVDSYRVIDWQRPIWGPVELDRVTLLESLGVDPTGQVARGAILLRRLLLIDWLAQAARFWFPPGAPTYDREIARLVEDVPFVYGSGLHTGPKSSPT